MNKPWKIIKKEDFKNTAQLIQELQEKKYILSEWILDIFKNYESKINQSDLPIYLYRIFVKDLGIKQATTLKEIYVEFKKLGYELVEPEMALITRLNYDEQEKGEWLTLC